MNFDILYPDVRESGETQLRQCQLVLLRMLKIIDYLCQKHEVKYFLVGGTLLGAIRHQGFIPWDDDMDVGFTRKEYDRFVQLVVPELPNDIFFQSPETDPAYPSCKNCENRIRDKYSSYPISEANKEKNQWHQGLSIDLFIYDLAFFPHNNLIYALNRTLLILFWKVGENNKGNLKRANVLKWISTYLPFPFVYASGFIVTKKTRKLGPNYIRKNEIRNLVKAKFEDMEAWVPQGWDACLKRQYGDYMKLPPVEKQKGHTISIPDPFTPCVHSESLVWKERIKP